MADLTDFLGRRHAHPSGSIGTGATPVVAPAVPMPGRRWQTRVLVPALLVLGLAALLAIAGRSALTPALAVRVLPVIVKADGSAGGTDGGGAGAGELVSQAAGWIEADPYAVSVPALSEGVVREVLVLEGDAVEAGDVVARLIDEDARIALGGAEAELAEAEAELQSARAELAAAQTRWDNPVDREGLVAGTRAMLDEARAELAQLPAMIGERAARAGEMRDELERKERLAEIRGVAAGELARLRLRLEAEEAGLEAARKNEGVLRAKVAQREAELRAATEELRLRVDEARMLALARAGVSLAEARVGRARWARDEAALRLARTEVVAPVAGVVLERIAEPGSRVMLGGEGGGGAILRLFDPGKLQVRADVPLAEASGVGPGQRAEVVVDALPERVFEGVVTRVVGQANIQKNTLQVKVALRDPAPQLRPEMLARVRLFGRGPEGGAAAAGAGSAGPERVLAPRAGLFEVAGDAARAWVVDKARSAATLRQVALAPGAGSGSGEWVRVESGLWPGDQLIEPGTPGLREGRRVRVAGEVPGEDDHGA
ncbi:MAG TPA: efflux RND transporter periplasmic adaptor subunit [Phycisphaerales bacterium]|nr:efflux RND transporter periplasmic adaptor subunit [Phycisphaerales bacterium]